MNLTLFYYSSYRSSSHVSSAFCCCFQIDGARIVWHFFSFRFFFLLFFKSSIYLTVFFRLIEQLFLLLGRHVSSYTAVLHISRILTFLIYILFMI